MLASLLKNVFGRETEPTVSLNTHEPDVYLVGYPGNLFRTFAPSIANSSRSNVKGIVSDRFAIDHPAIKLWGREFPIISLPQLQLNASNGPVEVVHFYEDLDQCWGLSTIAGIRNVKIVDFLSRLDALDLPHTYMLVKDERAWWEKQSEDDIHTLAKHFSDARSQSTLNARIESIRSGSRLPLMEAGMGGEYEYFNASTPQASLIPRDNEIYVDVGAAHGDTVDRFLALTHGRFQKIHAFEPTPGQFSQLQKHSLADSRIATHRMALGEASGSITFYDNAHNPFGGNALAGEGSGTPIQVECAKLDDIVDECTLLKMDVEGYECRVLRGAREVIRRSRPNMAITCYHYPQDLSEILAEVKDIHSYRHVALRHYGPSLYDSILLFSDSQSFS